MQYVSSTSKNASYSRVLDKVRNDMVTTNRAHVVSLKEEAKLMDHMKESVNLGFANT